MIRLGGVIFFCVLILSAQGQQLKEYYTLEDHCSVETVALIVDAPKGEWQIHAQPNQQNAISILGNATLEDLTPVFTTKQHELTKTITFSFQELASQHISDLFDLHSHKNKWEVKLSQTKKYLLDLSYGIGNSKIDLSNAAIKNFNINTGSANVEIDFSDPVGNYCYIDSFVVNVGMGSVKAYHISRSKAPKIVAKVGFGNALLDFREEETLGCEIFASIDAGNLEVLLSSQESPTMIKLKHSPLCGISLPKEFEEVEEDVYINSLYHPHAINLKVFNIDVAMGNVIFKKI